MTQEEIWQRYAARNPKLNDPEASVTLSVGNLRKMLGQVYDAGVHAATPPPAADLPPGFDALFGKFRP